VCRLVVKIKHLHAKKRNWLQNLGLEVETAIAQLPTNEREAYRKIVVDRLHTLHQNNNTNPTHDTHPEARLINSIKSKLRKNNAMIARADKGNSSHTPYATISFEDTRLPPRKQLHNYHQGPHKLFPSREQNTIKQSRSLIPKDNRWKYTNLIPSAPPSKG
jgi:hypothetical protein